MEKARYRWLLAVSVTSITWSPHVCRVTDMCHCQRRIINVIGHRAPSRRTAIGPQDLGAITCGEWCPQYKPDGVGRHRRRRRSGDAHTQQGRDTYIQS